MNTNSYVYGEWFEGEGNGRDVFHAVTGERIARVSSEGMDFGRVLDYGRKRGGPALRALTMHQRAAALKALAKHLTARKDEFYEISARSGTTRRDAMVDVDGGIGTLFSYASIARREFANERFVVEGEAERLSGDGTFAGRHLLVPRRGVALHINAFNFPCWGMLEKLAPSFLAGMPVVVKPATDTAYLTEAMVREIIASGILPEGALQLVCGSVGDLLDRLEDQDCLTLTGSAATANHVRQHPNVVARNIRFNAEADSLNCCILGRAVEPGDPEFDLFVREVVREMTVKAGQKCTAIRRVLVPEDKVDAVVAALREALAKVTIGDPAAEGVTMGPLVSAAQKCNVQATVEALTGECALLLGGNDDFDLVGERAARDAFFPPTLLYCNNPMNPEAQAHRLEAFGPVSTLMPYTTSEQAAQIAAFGRGSLVTSVFTNDDTEASELVFECAPYHGRLLVVNRDCAAASTGHGSPLPQLVHGGPGRAGGGEELGGVRAVKHYMQRCSLQGSPTTLTAVTREYMPGALTTSTPVHPFRKHFEELAVGESLTTHRRTVTEADIVNFGCLTGDHFYAHFDEIAAKESLFGKRVAHGYFVISAAAGLFVEPAPGPVLANYGLENLRFVEPVGIGDTIGARITVKQKIEKQARPREQGTGVVVWNVEVTNQTGGLCATYDILTLVQKKN
ncbi:phenylacetic acid degradation bifunctional protein PaaZ [Gilvimarinus sp. F26214L]|uniref:phenylacetic acid degradation bifunctional protein PaaZ n=1 Tax=Gilvimarinus sp. DZF01 TaxID=3461371 RepID=UPI00404541A1